MTTDEAKELKRKLKNDINNLKGYPAKTEKTKDAKNEVLKNVKFPLKGFLKVIKGFEDGDFLIKYFSKQDEDKQDEQPSTSKDEEESDESEESGEFEKDEEVNPDWIHGTKK